MTCSACTQPILARGLCGAHYARWRRTGTVRPEVVIGGPSAAERFAAKVDQSGGPNACWLWMGGRDRAGYGTFTVNRVTYKAHRYALVGTRRGRDIVVMHRCDNPPCVNPAHLTIGTYVANNRDRMVKGRGRNQWHKVTPGLVNEIHGRYQRGVVSQQAVADSLGVSQALVSQVLRGVAQPH